MRTPLPQPLKFSQYFNLGISSDDLDFVDIYANEDLRLFLDPYGIAAIGDSWSQECEGAIAGYFQFLVDSIRSNDDKAIKQLLSALHEVDEVALGFSKGTSRGKGIGEVQAGEILNAFKHSAAAQSGDIKDIADCALMIPGINRDKISDITANILKRKLVEFTQAQCAKHNIPTQRVAVNNVFDPNKLRFESYYTKLPMINGKAKILLPVGSVRREPQLSKDKYYRNFVLEFLRAEHEHPGDALAEALRNGRVVVRIGDLKKKYPKTVKLLYEFSKEHPHILDKYKAELRRTASKNEAPKLKTEQKNLNAQERMKYLNAIVPGRDAAHQYHKLIFDNLIYIFGNRADMPDREKEVNEGRKRIDIVFHNRDKTGFFHELNHTYHIQCPKIMIECKNYSEDISNPEIDQMANRLNSRIGMFGIIVCRSVKNPDAVMKKCKDIRNDNKGNLIVLEDIDIAELLNYREENNETAIDNYLVRKLDALLM
ncbi:MAG: hypothetical protein ACKVOR_01715 [Flavobacteriales bacterium]